MRNRNLVLWAGLILILVSVNTLIFQKESILARGQIMFLQLAPRDPRSLIQGDYMSLRYTLAEEIAGRLASARSCSGYAVVRLDDQRVAHFVRLHEPARALADDEALLRFRKRGRRVRLASDAFFFQEGQASFYQSAHYGEVRVDRAGEAVLTGLRGGKLERLGADVSPGPSGRR